jgi:heparosan-N-sulfate-glucuronate 5-epimerase
VAAQPDADAGLGRRAVRVLTQEIDDLLGRGPLFTHQPLGPNLDPAELDGYYCDFRHKADVPRLGDESLGPAARRTYHGGVIPIAQVGLGSWELLIEGRDTRADFLSVAEVLLEDARPGPGGRGVAWYTDLLVPKFGLTHPWPSAMGQGEAISVLLRAHRLTGEARYAEVAAAALEPMVVDVDDGGVARRLDGHLVLEEYPTPGRVGAVLNGWIFALFGLHELGRHGHPPAADVFAESMHGLLSLLPRYDVGWWSCYSLIREMGMADLAKPFYQRLHPVMLRALHRIEPDERLILVAERWERQLTPPALARSAANKLLYRGVRSSPARAVRSGLSGNRAPAA